MIGITSSINKEKPLLTTGIDNVNSITKAGGIPVVLPNLQDENAIHHLARNISGFLLTGGIDVDPSLYGEEPLPELRKVCPDRDYFELTMVRKCLELNIPILAMCRGCQMLNVAAGGSLYQDIYKQINRELLQHYQKSPRYHASHTVEVTEQSLLHEIMETTHFKVNSFHHQAVKELADGFEVSARTSDGIVEGYESKKHRFVLGVQWHPENLMRRDEYYSYKLFKAFVSACKQTK